MTVSGGDDDAAARLLAELDAWVVARALPDPAPDREGEWEAGYEFLRGKLADWVDERRDRGAQNEGSAQQRSEDA